MGWSNGPPRWAELERVLSGRPDNFPAAKKTVDTEPEPVRSQPSEQPVVPYAELHAHSAYSFLDGACGPETLVEEARNLGLTALALTDHDGLYGVVQFAQAAAEVGLPTVFGAELSLVRPGETRMGVPDPAGEHLLVLARGQEGYRRLSREISAAHLAGGEKGSVSYDLDRLTAAAGGYWQILTGCRKGKVQKALQQGDAAAERALRELIDRFGSERVTVELTYHGIPEDDQRNSRLIALAARVGLPAIATTAAHFATPADRRRAMALAAIRARRSLDEMDGWLPPGGGGFLRSGAEMARLFAQYPEVVANAARLGADCAFDLRLIAPKLPPFETPADHDEDSWLRELTLSAAATRYGPPIHNPPAYRQLEHELRIVARLGFAGYFLIVRDIVEFCRAQGILCQGRGSAANSAVCYVIGITTVDPVGNNLLFERFLSPERDGPPDIDLDIESKRREEVIHYVYHKYGRDHAAQVANVITYRGRSAVRDAARVLGFSPGQQDSWSRQISHWSTLEEETDTDIPEQVRNLASDITGLPRHMGIHSGGMVICDRPIADVCPVEWARMPGRSVVQWDKDDCAAAGLVKFDLLGLGILSALRSMIDLVRDHTGQLVELHRLDLREPEVYAMLSRGDSVGVFQVESRAQMATLPRLRPRNFFDLVVQVGLIRPGPIQGGSVHPYIRRRNGREEVRYEHESLRNSLQRTLGVPLFQEQLMQLAVDVAGFSAAEADQLRRAMGAKRSTGKMVRLRERFYEGMRELHGITGDVADRIYEKVAAFANYGFPESHAQSFASLVFYSAWFKLHHPAAFCAGLLNAQPMGFYSPQSLVSDARRHGVIVHGPDINASNSLANLAKNGTEIRLGLSAIRTIGTEFAEKIVLARQEKGEFSTFQELARRVEITTTQAEALATAGALDGLGSTRRQALWTAGAAARERAEHLPGARTIPEPPTLPGMKEWEKAAADIWATGVSPESYPTEFLRKYLASRGVLTANRLSDHPDGAKVLVAGAVTHRQRPPTAAGITFLNLEDETGLINVVCSPGLWRRHPRAARNAPALLIRGRLQNTDGATSVYAETLQPLPLPTPSESRDFR